MSHDANGVRPAHVAPFPAAVLTLLPHACAHAREQPLHTVAVFNITTTPLIPVVPYPPQPRYQCPEWKAGRNGTSLQVLPGETRLVDFKLPPATRAIHTWVATAAGERWFADPVGSNCRLVSASSVYAACASRC